MRKLIAIGLSPNTDVSDVVVALQTFFQPWKWMTGSSFEQVKSWFQGKFPSHAVYLLTSARSGLYALLKAYDIGPGDEVLLQACTCVAVPNSVLWTGATPVYVDIDDTYNIDVFDAQKKLTKQTRAIIVQHTFGVPADMEKVMRFAKKYSLLVFEDCAHALGATYNGQLVGTLGDGACFSFGRDKIVSSVFGGSAIIPMHQGTAQKKLEQFVGQLPRPSYAWVAQQLFHPIACAIILPFYQLIIGKILLVLFQKIHLLSFPVLPMELLGHEPKKYHRVYPNALASLLVHQLSKLSLANEQRQSIAKKYAQALQQTIVKEAIYLRYPLIVRDAQSICQRAKRQGMLLGRWYDHVIDPKNVVFAAIGYHSGSCPKAEFLANKIINLPTRITDTQAQQVLAIVNLRLP